VSSKLLETERLLREALGENALLKELEKMASTWIQAAESNHKSVEARLKSVEHQVKEFEKKYNAEFDKVFELRVENKNILAELEATRAAVKKAEDEGQAYYDQGFNEATESLKSQLGRECNHCFLQGWDLTQL
jgi:uncharacterized protein (DUF2164 family)